MLLENLHSLCAHAVNNEYQYALRECTLPTLHMCNVCFMHDSRIQKDESISELETVYKFWASKKRIFQCGK